MGVAARDVAVQRLLGRPIPALLLLVGSAVRDSSFTVAPHPSCATAQLCKLHTHLLCLRQTCWSLVVHSM